MDWHQLASRLADGSSERVDCCGTDKSAIINNRPREYTFWCFRCGRFESKRKDNLRVTKWQEPNKIELKVDSSWKKLPEKANIWLWGRGINPSLSLKYGLKWNGRIVIPVYHLNRLVSIMMRAIEDGRQPKMKNSEDRLERLFWSLNATGDTVVVVEDCFSCMKVGEVLPCIALNGTSLSDADLKHILKYKVVLIWLDPDMPGRKASVKLKKKIQSLVTVRIIKSKRDPKYYSTDEIKKITNEMVK